VFEPHFLHGIGSFAGATSLSAIQEVGFVFVEGLNFLAEVRA
jgi:hypothetical protein